jgi:uncharacterized damage-inducible protein DinB
MTMDSELDLKGAILGAWTTNNRVTEYLIERVPLDLWRAPAPAGKHRSVRSIAAHLHNSRRMWIGTLGREHGIAVPARVDERTVTRRGLVAALKRSHRGMVSLLALGLERGGRIPATAAYVWRNLPLDVGHVLAYFVAHEGHHRGQIVLLARQMGHRLPVEVTGGLWQWTRRSAEAG